MYCLVYYFGFAIQSNVVSLTHNQALHSKFNFEPLNINKVDISQRPNPRKIIGKILNPGAYVEEKDGNLLVKFYKESIVNVANNQKKYPLRKFEIARNYYRDSIKTRFIKSSNKFIWNNKLSIETINLVFQRLFPDEYQLSNIKNIGCDNSSYQKVIEIFISAINEALLLSELKSGNILVIEYLKKWLLETDKIPATQTKEDIIEEGISQLKILLDSKKPSIFVSINWIYKQKKISSEEIINAIRADFENRFVNSSCVTTRAFIFDLITDFEIKIANDSFVNTTNKKESSCCII